MPTPKNPIEIQKSSSAKPDNTIAVHAHQQHELYFLLSGHRRYFIGHTIYDVYPGNLIIIPKTELHQTTSPGRTGYERYVVYFSDEDVQPLLAHMDRSILDDLLQVCCLQLPAEVVRRVQKDLTQMEQESLEGTPLSQAYIANLLQSILLAALRHGKKRSPCSGEAADKIQEVARYISENYYMPLSLHDAAQMAFMEDTYFSKRFKKLTGFGFQEYLTQTRIRAAERMLLETALPVGDIAERCGFSSSNYFGDAFRHWKGISPSAYREALHNYP